MTSIWIKADYLGIDIRKYVVSHKPLVFINSNHNAYNLIIHKTVLKLYIKTNGKNKVSI